MRACFFKSIPCPQARLAPRFLVGVETGYLSVMHTDGMKVYRSELVASYVCVLPVST